LFENWEKSQRTLCKRVSRIKKNIECKNCGKTGHTIKYCSFIEKCKFCERVGHTEEKCFYKPANNIPKCSECKRFGHTYIECFHVSSQDKQKYLDDKKKKEEAYQEKLRQEEIIKQKYKEKGFTYDIKYLKFCKEQFERNPNFRPWIIFCEEDSDQEFDYENPGLTEKKQKALDDIKYQTIMLE